MSLPDGTLITVYEPNGVGYYDLTTVDVADLASSPGGSYIYAYVANGVGSFNFQQVLVSDIGDLPAGSEAWVREPNGVGWYDAARVATTELAGSYAGPLDIVPGAVVAYSQRAMSAALRGTALFSIADGPGGTSQSFNSDAVTGDAPSAAIAVFTSSPRIQRWNDQGSAQLDVLQDTGANQVPWVADLVNGKPGFDTFPNEGALSENTSETPFGTITGSATIFIIAKTVGILLNIAPGADPYLTISTGAGSALLDLYDGANEAGGRFDASVVTDTFHIWEGVWEYGSGNFYVDGVALVETNNFDSGGPLSSWDLVDAFVTNADGGTLANTGIAEIVYWPSILSAPNRLAIRQNIAAYYGITL